MNEVSFTVTSEERRLIGEIVARAEREDMLDGMSTDSVDMDLTACHANGCRLRLSALLGGRLDHFGHDVLGISRYIDRNTGRLTNHFVPRYAEPDQTV